MRLLIEPHSHTSEVSACGGLTAHELVVLNKKAGVGVLVVTDHCCAGQWRRRMSVKAQADAFLSGYRNAKKAGDAMGLIVLLGMEARLYEGPEDYLIYGLSEKDVPPLIGGIESGRGIREFHALANRRGLVLIQAHPKRPYLRTADPAHVDGYEVVNGNPRQANNNDAACEYAEGLTGMLMTAGSDVHQAEDVGATGMWTDDVIADNAALVAFLRKNPRPDFR